MTPNQTREDETASESMNFQTALLAPGRSPEIPASADIYGWLVGSWELNVTHYWEDVRHRGIKAEMRAGWVLEGRAIQDVWIMPRIADRSPLLGKTTNMYGTTLRVWDPSLEAWRITWINPVTGHCQQQIGRRVGADIVQIGCNASGIPSRWRFMEITENSFHWIGELLEPDGRTWKVGGEFLATRLHRG